VSPQASTASVWNGAWHNAAGTFDGSKVRLYIDAIRIWNSARPIDLYWAIARSLLARR
jgi:hypothetical protein